MEPTFKWTPGFIPYPGTVLDTAFVQQFCQESVLDLKGYKEDSDVHIYISNLILKPDFKTSSLIEDTRNGILVNDIMGSFSADFSTGKFGFDAKNVFLIENGEIRHPVDDISIVGDIVDFFQKMEPADDAKQEGLLLASSIRIYASVIA